MAEPTPPLRDEAVTTPVGVRTICPQCGAALDAVTTSCGVCGAVITGGGAEAERAERVRLRLQDGIGDAYVLGELLGRGGMGIVFRAREKALDRDVALKVLAFDPMLAPDAYDRFEREARLAARLDHPHIVPIFAVGQRGSVAFYTMRLVKGGSLEELMLRSGAVELPRAAALLEEVAEALDYAHAAGVVHRDVKPANVLLSESGHAMVADFGIARAFSADGAATSANATGVVGSPGYMSPEQWRAERVDGRADQYALGVMAFELLTGVRPFQHASMQELLRMHLAEDPPDARSLRGAIPVNASDAIRRAMAKDPAERFASATEFVRALTTEGATAPASTTIGRAPAPRRAIAPTAPAAVTLPPPAPPRASSARWRWVTLALLLITAAIPAVRWREQRMAAARGALAGDAPPAPAATASPTEVAAPTPMDSVTQALQRELADTRRIAIEAQQRADRLEAQRTTTESKPTATAEPAPNVPGPPIPGPIAAPSYAMLRVSTIGAFTEIALDGGASGIVGNGWVKLTPGRHQVTATGDLRFTPPTYVVNAVAGDTLWVIFAREGSVPAGVPRQLFIPHNYKWLPAQQRRQLEAFASGELLQRLKGMRAPTRPLSEGRLRP